MKKLLCSVALLAGLVVGPAWADTKLQLVEVITSPQRTDLLKQQVAGFEQANPGVTVDIVSLPWGQAFEKLLTMVQGGQIPDVVEMPERWLSLYASNGQLESLEPWLAKWEDTGQLTDRTLQFGRVVKNTAYMIPYGFYIRAMFYNKKLFEQAGLSGPPQTLDEFMTDAQKISAIPGKSGYCLRGSKGGFSGWYMFMATMNGKGDWFTQDGTSTFNEPGAVKGFQYLVDLYQKGYAPKDSVNWGFNEIVSGFYSGTCAMLDQDPDALIAIAERMNKDDYDVVPMPKGPAGKAFPTIGYASWSMFANSKNKDLAWKLIATLDGPEGNVAWNKRTGALPIYKTAINDPFYANPQFKGWFDEL
ncbi:MAG TPA: sugar ABC transporter substrate-binding protein, partial [Candidatus Angelobacter sp.]|nr:sugar ABC transporter substrate-binding protein [Candidatus Angelobacter sp.]